MERRLDVRRLGRVPYVEALDLQAELVRRRREGKLPDTLLLLEHPHVITLGSGSSEEHLLLERDELARRGIELHDVGRGGDVTYHGPGQLVGYPVLDLKPDRRDLHAYLRSLEGAIISALGSLGVTAGRAEGLTGVWVDGAKVAAIGVRVSSGWITSHGFALNVSTDLSFFGTIVPCGITDRAVTSLEAILGHVPRRAEIEARVVDAFRSEFGYGRPGPASPPTYPASRSPGGRNS